MKIICSAICFFLLIPFISEAQVFSDKQIADLIETLRNDVRGPYRDIKWFCDDGTMRDSKDPCPDEVGGVQHARMKDIVLDLADKNHLFFGQILTGTAKEDFWDSSNNNARIKQYHLEQFLVNNDNGWILEKARFYRGSKQIEDEMAWGNEFLEYVLTNNQRLRENFLLLRMTGRYLPHGEDTFTGQQVRAYSKLMGDIYPSFMDLRTKIHNDPDAEDLKKVKAFQKEHAGELSDQGDKYLSSLITSMEEYYQPFDLDQIATVARYLPDDSILKNELESFTLHEGSDLHLSIMAACELLPLLRENIYETRWSKARVQVLNLINNLEDWLIKEMSQWDEKNLAILRDKSCYLTEAAYGLGYLEQWEYDKLLPELNWMYGDQVKLQDLNYFINAANKTIYWSTSNIISQYRDVIQTYEGFEPMAIGFSDDLIRSTVLLPLGHSISHINDIYGKYAPVNHQLLGIRNPGRIQGLNPGLTVGELVVLSHIPEDYHFDKKKIYVFDRPPGELQPVAGMANVQEGNPISHIQLLARNLAIPNALISIDAMKELEEYNGKHVFYAVSSGGTVVMKLKEDMSVDEREIFSEKSRSDIRITVATEKLILKKDSLLDMSLIDASFSGRWCGPKAANLGQLKQMFPENVVDGIVIPFGIFKDHMNQEIPGVGESYWSFLQRIFEDKENMLAQGVEENEIQCIVLQELKQLQSYIEKMPLKKTLVEKLEDKFQSILGMPLGEIPVFLRSDTNMEDLPEFTGAGLNLTLFNVLERDKILQGIRQVWASPYSERSYNWRQSYLLNPEDVYPSILIIPSVNVDKSGVIITKGVSNNKEDDITVAFSRGVGGAVDGQSAESYLLYSQGYNELISPSREYRYRTIPSTGGSELVNTNFQSPILDEYDLWKIRQLVKEVNEKMKLQLNQVGPFDIELGFKDEKIWLFQIRPFVENRSALASEYLESLSPDINNIMVPII